MSLFPKPKKVDQRLIKKRKDPTLKAHPIKKEQLPYVIYDLITRIDLTIVRAMNYAKILNVNMEKYALHELLDLIDPIMPHNSDVLFFFGGLEPSSFKLYCYWFSRFLWFIVLTQEGKYTIISDIDLQVIKFYLYSEGRRGLQPGTIRGQLSSIKYMLSPFQKHFHYLFIENIEIKHLFSFLEKNLGRPVKKRAPVTYFIIFQILDHIVFAVLIDVRDWFLIITGHVAGFRGGELALVKWTDVVIESYFDQFNQEDMNILVIFLEKTKTKNKNEGAVVTISVPNSCDSFNLFLVLRQYIKLLKRESYLNDWLFPSLSHQDRRKNKHINTKTIRSIVKKRVKQIGLDPSLYGAHSLRTAYVHDAIAAGIPPTLIKKTGRWKSQCWMGYFHDEKYAQAQSSTRMMKFQQSYETKKSKKKHQELLDTINKKLKW